MTVAQIADLKWPTKAVASHVTRVGGRRAVDALSVLCYTHGGDMDIVQREVLIYVTSDGHCPYEDWFNSLKNETTQSAIEARVARIRAGNLGDYKSLGAGLIEFRIHQGPGYRIYAGQDGRRIIVLVNGGDKRTQRRDIDTAAIYWQDYRRRTHARG